jgi:hypothetical protein
MIFPWEQLLNHREDRPTRNGLGCARAEVHAEPSFEDALTPVVIEEQIVQAVPSAEEGHHLNCWSCPSVKVLDSSQCPLAAKITLNQIQLPGNQR